MRIHQIIPKLKTALYLSTQESKPQSVSFSYSSLDRNDLIYDVFKWLYTHEVDFQTQRCEFRFLVIVYPKIAPTKDNNQCFLSYDSLVARNSDGEFFSVGETVGNSNYEVGITFVVKAFKFDEVSGSVRVYFPSNPSTLLDNLYKL